VTDIPEDSDVIESISTEPTPAGSKAGFGKLVILLIVLALLAGGGWWLWEHIQELRARAAVAAEQSDLIDALRQQVNELDARIAQNHQSQRNLSTRMDDVAGTHRVLRNEMLGVGERAAALEEAVNRLADSRESSATNLRLDETEHLLRIGQERIELFGDAAGAARAFALADDVLSGLDDPGFAGLRQTVAEELALLRGAPVAPRQRVLARLDTLLAGIDRLPARPSEIYAQEGGDASTLRSILARLVTVQRVDQGGATLSPARIAAQRAALDLDLGVARAAAERGDQDAFQAALLRAAAQLERAFDPDADAVQQAVGQLETLAKESLEARMPELGASQRELRALRNLRRPTSIKFAPLPPPAPAEARIEADVE
jgi:uroporphyrin-3 C-methyltransferase